MAEGKFSPVSLQPGGENGDSTSFTAIPLVIPNDMQYDPSANALSRLEGKERTQLKLVDEAVQMLEQINKPVAVVAIAGPYRTGKSYILSRLLGPKSVFDLGHTMNAKTFGIWMATTVLECDEYAIVLLDTEGIDAVTATGSSDASILVLTILLSSYLIYNSVSVPNKNDLEKMSMFVTLANQVVVKQGQPPSVSEFCKHFPDFLWLLRDVILTPTNEKGESITPTEFLKTKVLVRSNAFFESPQDMVARAILTFFPTIECHTLPPPSSNPDVLKAIQESSGELTEEFNQAVEHLLVYLKEKIQIKKGFRDGKATGPVLAALAKTYVDAINDPDAIPALDNTWESAVLLRTKKLMEDLTNEYKQELAGKISDVAGDCPLEEDVGGMETDQDTLPTLMGLHRQVLSEKVKKLLQFLSVVGINESEKFVQELEDGVVQFEEADAALPGSEEVKRKVVVGGVVHKFLVCNHAKSTTFCKQLFEDLYTPISEKSLDAEITYQEILQDLRQLQEKYFRQSRGPAKWEVYEAKKQLIEAEKLKFTRLKGYEEELQKTAEAAERANLENVRLAEEVNVVHTQIVEEAQMHKKTIEQIQLHHQEAMDQAKLQEEAQRARDERKYQELLQAQMKEMAEISKRSTTAAEEEQKMLLLMMEKSQEANAQALHQLTGVIQRAPPVNARAVSESRQCILL